MSSILDFYRYDSPRGIPVKKVASWTTSSTTSLVITPISGKIFFVKSLAFLIDCTTDFGAGTLSIIHSNHTFAGAESTTLSFSNVDNLIASFSPGTVQQLDAYVKGHMVFEVPVYLDAASSHTLTTSFSLSGLSAGQLDIIASGWYIASTDL